MQAAVRQSTLEIRGLPLVVREAGDGQPLLYLHDELSTGWSGFLDQLSERFHVVSPELPGYGDTERPEWVETIDDMAFLVSDIADVIGAGGPVPVVGSSLGAWMALESALRGAAIGKLVLLGSPGAQLPGDPPFDYFFLTPEQRAELFFNDPARAPEVSEDHVVRNEAMTARLTWQPRYVSPKLLYRIHRAVAPTLVIWGADDRFLSRAHGEAIADGLPNGKLAVVDGAGHFPALDQPAKTARLAIEFVS